jgi:hypothetical protein
VLNHEGWELEISFHPEPKLVDFQWNVPHVETKNFSDSGRDLIVVHLYRPTERVDLAGMRGRIREQRRDEPPLILRGNGSVTGAFEWKRYDLVAPDVLSKMRIDEPVREERWPQMSHRHTGPVENAFQWLSAAWLFALERAEICDMFMIADTPASRAAWAK